MTPTSESIAMDTSLGFADAMNWLYQNTNFPTFEQFCENPDKWRENKNEIFDSIDNLNVFFKERVSEVKYYWRGKYHCSSLEKIYDVARNEGFNGAQLEMEPIAEPLDGTSNHYKTRVSIRVNVWPKDEFRLRGGIVAND